MRRLTSILIGGAVALAVQVGATSASGEGPTFRWSAWHQVCGFSHRNRDDPIVFPRQPGRMHDHTYFGNRSTNAFSTPASLGRSARTTCAERGDKAAYWVPTLFVRGNAIAPRGVLVRYLRRTHEPVDPFPAGLKMIAGDMHARAPQSQHVTSWSCATPSHGRSSALPTCPGTRSGGLVLRVAFPDCWDGKRLDSPDHRRHMTYSTDGACPPSHAVELPALTLYVFYGVRGGRSSELASGGRFSGHGDFVNAWNQAGLAGIVRRYLNDTDKTAPRAEPPDPVRLGICERCSSG